MEQVLSKGKSFTQSMSDRVQVSGLVALNIAVLTVSDTRGMKEDLSGQILSDRIQSSGHHLVAREIQADNIYAIRAVLSQWIADANVQIVMVTGGTGIAARDVTPEAVIPLLDKSIDGFGELFRSLSFEEIGTATLQSRALAGVANHTAVFCLPGSPGACALAWDKLLQLQLDSRTKPCNFTELVARR